MADSQAKLTNKQKEKLSEISGKLSQTGLPSLQNQLAGSSTEWNIRFKAKVGGIVKSEHRDDDAYLLRWLRARNFDVTKAQDMLQKHIVWRKEWDVDHIYEWDPPAVLTKFWPGGVFGQDKEGYPIFIEPMGALDLKGLMLSAKTKDLLRYTIRIMEDMMQGIELKKKELGSHIDKIVVIEDWEGFGMRELFTPGLKEVMTKSFDMMESNYPEIMKTILVVNAPGIMPALWTMVKPFLSEDTKKKVNVLGKNYQESLLKVIDKDQLPKHYGGTATDPDGNEYCVSKLNQGGKIPEEYYLTGAKLVDDPSKVTTVNVKSGGKLDLEFKANKGDTLRWVFWTDKSDIAFGVFVKKDSGELKEIEPCVRLACHKLPEDGIIECPENTTYVLRFDNSHSRMTAKTLHYSIDVVELDIAPGFEDLTIHL